MIETVIIDGKSVPFKVTGGFLLRYKEMTGRDPIKELARLESLTRKSKSIAISLEDLAMDDLTVIYNLLWVMAKTADNGVPNSLLDWVESFEIFPIQDIIKKVTPLIASAFSSSIEIKTPLKKTQLQTTM